MISQISLQSFIVALMPNITEEYDRLSNEYQG